MKNLLRVGLQIFLILFIIFTYSCQKSEDEFKIKKDKISGYVQKGPYINGTSIQMFEMDSSLTQTGKVFNTQISSNRGSFEISDIELTSQYVEFLARGYYFNEIIGAISPSELTLYALSDITDITTVNVNMLTHLEKSRVEYLVSNNSTFANAKDTAQKEILAIFGFQLNEMDNSETLDISVNKNENAILLAISLILQANRSVGDLSELLAIFIADIHQDGELNSDNIKSQLRNSALELNLATIRLNLENRFGELGISPSIPNFEQYINVFLEFTGGLFPIASTQVATNITTTGATLSGIVNANDISTMVTFEYGTSTYYGDKINATQGPISGNDNTIVNATINDLTPGTTYHYRVKAENSFGVTYGNDLSFSTVLNDVNGNIYNVIIIGTQVWMKENLKTTKYSDGTDIPLINTEEAWSVLTFTNKAYCWYDDDIGNKEVYGALYTWAAAMNGMTSSDSDPSGVQGVCPSGWHLPSDSEWILLTNYLGEGVAGGKLKEEGTSHWLYVNTGATNETGFTALPGGIRNFNGTFESLGSVGRWWSSTSIEHDPYYVWGESLYFNQVYIYRSMANKKDGRSIRCIKD